MRPAQLEAQLWDDERLRVFAVVMGSRIPDLPQRLASADIVDHDCLRPGALTRAEQLEAAYLVQLQRGSEFGRWLLFEAAATLPDWGVVVLTAAAPLALRSHLRALSEARLPEGASIELEWMDPVILRALLPHFDASALRGFMGPIQAWVIPGAAQWHRAELVTGQLQWREAALAQGT
jgi:hypothetical protein